MAFRGKFLKQVTCYHQSHRFMADLSKYKKMNFAKQGRMMTKLVVGDAIERKQWKQGLPSRKPITPRTLPEKRLEILNKLFLSTITDGLTTSTRAQELADHGLLINEVDLSPCGRYVHVLWTSQSLESDIEVEKLLNDTIDELRLNIVTKSVSGFVPNIIFEKDKAGCIARDVHLVLESPKVRRDIDIQDVTDQNAETAVKNEPVSFAAVMSTNILGLRRSDVLKRIKAVTKCVKTEIRASDEQDREIPERLSNVDARSQKTAILSYMQKQKKLENKRFRESLEYRQYALAMKELGYKAEEEVEDTFSEEEDEDEDDDNWEDEDNTDDQHESASSKTVV